MDFEVEANLDNRNTPAWKEQKRKELKMRIAKLGKKLTDATNDAIHYKRRMKGWSRNSIMKHSYEMARRSIRATRKQIYKLEAELRALK